MPSNPKVKALANQAAVKIKVLTEAHESQITAIYQDFRQQVAEIQSNAEELESPSVTPFQPTEIDRSNKQL